MRYRATRSFESRRGARLVPGRPISRAGRRLRNRRPVLLHTERVRTTALVSLIAFFLATSSAQAASPSPVAVPGAPALRSGASWADVVTAVRPSVVRIENSSCGGGSFVGTGFSVGGLIVTNRHVVEDYASLSVRLADERVLVPTEVRLSDADDLALIKVPVVVPTLTWAPKEPRVADEVAALGFPEAIGFSFAKGSVSALNVSLESRGERIRGLMQTDAAVNFGNSGGPLINRRGQVVGVVVLTLADTEGLAFAVEGRRAQRFVENRTSRALARCVRRTVTTTPPTSTRPPAYVVSAAEQVVRAFYSAIEAGDYRTAWEIGGKNFVKNSTYERFAAGFSKTVKSELLVLDAVGDVVTVQLTAREQVAGATRISVYRGTYLVRNGEIRSGGLKLRSRR
jgi:S1-C subfamily serine protease